MVEEKKHEKAEKDSLAEEEKKLKKELKNLEKEEAEIKEEIKEKEIDEMPGRYARICPNCKSFNVKTEFPISPAYGVADYVCLDCNFRGKVFPEINIHDKKEEKDREIKKEEKVEVEKESSEEKTQEEK